AGGLLYPGRFQEALGVLLEQKSLLHEALNNATHLLHIVVVAAVPLLDRWSRVTARLPFPFRPGEREEAAGVRKRIGTAEAGLADRPARVSANGDLDVGVTQTREVITVAVDQGN